MDYGYQDDAKEYMSKRNVSSNLQNRVQRWFDYSWERYDCINIIIIKVDTQYYTTVKRDIHIIII